VKRIAVLLAIAVLLLPACGKDKKDSGLKADGTTATNPDGTPADGGTATTAKGQSGNGKTGTTVKGQTGTTAAGGAGGTTTTTKPHVPVVINLDKTCVRRGSTGDTQGLSVKTDPSDVVAFSTEYSDHSNELSNQSYKTGSGYGRASTNGDYRTEWKVPDNAPTGTATLHIIAQNKIQAPVTFKVVGQLESC
jgi:hypothetical protein